MEANLYSFISRVSLDKEVKDVREWRSDDLGLLSVKSTYDLLAKHASGQHNELFTCLWKVKALPNVVTAT